MIAKLEPYIPIHARLPLNQLLNNYQFTLKIVGGRKTKRGDFRATAPLPTITINNNLSKEQFLITLVHEIAHLETYIKTPKARPHGTEWKQNFKLLMLPFLIPTIFDEHLLKLLAKHFINPKATTDTDTKLSAYLQKQNKTTDNHNCFIFDLELGTLFKLQNRIFKILNKRRTRYECLELKTNKKYLIRGNASVTIIDSLKDSYDN